MNRCGERIKLSILAESPPWNREALLREKTICEAFPGGLTKLENCSIKYAIYFVNLMEHKFKSEKIIYGFKSHLLLF